MRTRAKYNDGLDDDGYPLKPAPYRQPFIRGSEADAGDFRPIRIGEANINALIRNKASHSIGSSAESPIEQQLGAAIILFFERAKVPIRLCLDLVRTDGDGGFILVPQFTWSHYRSDWAVINLATDGVLLIECDGRDFHSSREQIAHDRKKDRAALDRGYLTFRFSGSQIFRDADSCAQKVFDAVCGGRHENI